MSKIDDGDPGAYNKATVLLSSFGILRISHLNKFCPEFSQITLSVLGGASVNDAILGWGHKSTAAKARQLAKQRKLPYIALEDGFLRSIQLGRDGEKPLSLVVDPVGIYYDARQPSQLEQWLEGGRWSQPELIERARNVRQWLIAERLSKYNHASEKQLWSDNKAERVLVIDQTFGDMSVVGALSGEQSFRNMLQAALDENPLAEIVVKTHPDVIAGHRKGYLPSVPDDPRIQLLCEDVNPWSVLDGVQKVYTVSSLLGFEALLAGKEVRCFGMPFYAGWGLTEDALTCKRRTRRCSLDELFATAYIKYARYVDPITKKRCEIEQIIRLLSDRRRHWLQTQGGVVCSGVSAWKKKFLPTFLSSAKRDVSFIRSPRKAADRAAHQKKKWALWASAETEQLRALASDLQLPMLRVEDAFLRSVGLGSDLVSPGSLVLDDEGIYYDGSRPSRMETLLRETDFSERLVDRARNLRAAIIEHGLTKYNVGSGVGWGGVDGKNLILVPGQVEDDASILRGSPRIRCNLDLLKAVRGKCPDSMIIYKPHPDVLVGNRRGVVDVKEALQWCDSVVTDISMERLLESVDEVHTMTSLAGFEALLRGKKVCCYGLPFYAGWGLTDDEVETTRRGRRLTLDELVAVALILYPTYVDPAGRSVCSVEHFIDWLVSHKGHIGRPPLKTRIIRKYQHWRQGS